MSAVQDRANVVETTYINEWADYHRLDFQVDASRFGSLGSDGEFDALDVLEVLRNGEVIESDMDEDCGLWTIIGETVDDDLMQICVRVKDAESRVELLELTRI